MCVIGVFEILHTLIGGYIRILVSSQIKRNPPLRAAPAARSPRDTAGPEAN